MRSPFPSPLLPTLALLLLASLLPACRPGTASSAKPAFHCPMHPTYTSNRQGDCPICNMRLVPIPSSPTSTSPSNPTSDPQPPHPEAHAHDAPRIPIAVSPEKQQLIGLKSQPVIRRRLARTLHTTGVLDHDETRLRRIAPRFGGWISHLAVNTTGQTVLPGDPLLTVYSPELLAAQNEYLVAYQRLRDLGNAPSHPSLAAASNLLAAARLRLQLLEIPDADLLALEQRGIPAPEITLRVPSPGHVISKSAIEGAAFAPGQTLFELGDLSRLWVRVSLVDADLALVQTGQTARVLLPRLGLPEITTTVAFIDPHIDPLTRRGEVRLVIDNPDLLLRPDLWAQIEIDTDAERRLAAPAAAILDTGHRSLAFVHRDDGHFEPRSVEIGLRTPDFVEVRSGLSEGDQVVTRALFLIDSESQLKAALDAMTAHHP